MRGRALSKNFWKKSRRPISLFSFFPFERRKEASFFSFGFLFEHYYRALCSRSHIGDREKEESLLGGGKQGGEEQQKAVEKSPSKKMFYALTLEKELELQPRFFGPRMREVLQQKLISEVRCWSRGRRMKSTKEREGMKEKASDAPLDGRRSKRRAKLSPPLLPLSLFKKKKKKTPL